ncbi:MAG: hypothetical protein GEV28_38560 [Actinophytocola sp.]|uniref:hypothetical protein n=1 Tax=Actinophytocola sp. TaxID=1872138 RepID=UPI001328BA28|nr:hypothetical protein [Actinophytocola sp.]MPZ85964.1 hypothetical protein [Actinophytocola sp.]
MNIEEGTATVVRDALGKRCVEVTFDGRRYTKSGEKPAAPREFVFLFDDSISVNVLSFPTCGRAVLAAQGPAGCPPGSKVGTGRAEFYGGGEAEVAVYNTRFANGMRGVLITVPALGTILDNTLEPVRGTYRRNYTLGLHEIVQPDGVPPQERGATSRFVVTFGATWHGRSFVESHARAGRPLDLGIWSHYVTGQVNLTEGQVARP